jgi:hypothetical protein
MSKQTQRAKQGLGALDLGGRNTLPLQPEAGFPQDSAGDIIAANRANDASVAADLLKRPQVARLTADAAEFQPSTSHDHPLYGQSGGDDNMFRVVPGEPGQVAGAVGDTRASNIVGDMVSGMPRAGDAFRDTPVDLGADMATGGEPDGPKSSNQPGAQNFYRSVKDYPDGQGSGTVGMEPTGQLTD